MSGRTWAPGVRLLAAVVAVVGLLAVGQQGLQLHLLLLARLRGPVCAAVGRLGVGNTQALLPAGASPAG